MVNIVNCCIRVNKLDQIFNNCNNIFFSQNSSIHISVESQLLINTVTTYLTEVVTLVREEQVLDHLTCTCIISRICITQLTINVVNSFLLRVCRIL